MHHGLAEIAKAAHRLNPAFETQGRVTFDATRPDEAPLVAWRAWTEQVWVPILGPAFISALEFARGGRIRELAKLDLELNEKLAPKAAEGSRKAGHRIFTVSRALRGEKGFEKFFPLIEKGAAAGHLISVHALRTAAFHVADPVAIGAYLYQEAVGGLFPNHPALVGNCVEEAWKINLISAEPTAFLRVA